MTKQHIIDMENYKNLINFFQQSLDILIAKGFRDNRLHDLEIAGMITADYKFIVYDYNLDSRRCNPALERVMLSGSVLEAVEIVKRNKEKLGIQ